MKYSVSINEDSRSITVTLADGTKGVAYCSPCDRFDINTGIELALERAKVAKAKANTAKTTAVAEYEKKLSVMELVKALESALPEGEMVIVGKGENMTEAQKKWLRSLIGDGCSCGGNCSCDDDDADEAYQRGYEDGYDDGYADGKEVGIAEMTEELETLEEEIETLENELDECRFECQRHESALDDIVTVLENYHEL